MTPTVREWECRMIGVRPRIVESTWGENLTASRRLYLGSNRCDSMSHTVEWLIHSSVVIPFASRDWLSAPNHQCGGRFCGNNTGAESSSVKYHCGITSRLIWRFYRFEERISRCRSFYDVLRETSNRNLFESEFINVTPMQQPEVEGGVWMATSHLVKAQWAGFVATGPSEGLEMGL